MAALLPPFPKFLAVDSAGASLPGALLYTYAAGTTTPLATCTDSTGLVFNSNPVICDSGGSANVWLTAGTAYKFVLQNSSGVVQWTVDNITGGIQGTAGAAGSVWRDGDGVPSNAVGANGDYYLNRHNGTGNGDIYLRSGGVYAKVGNIAGPAGATRNVVTNGTFYNGLTPWITTGAVAPYLGTGSTAQLGAALMLASTSVTKTTTSVGSINQSFSIQTPDVTPQLLTFNTACYYESVAASGSNSGTVKVYIYNGSGGTETLVGTFPLTASSATPAWSAQSIDVTANLTVAGDYGVRFELTAYADHSGVSAGHGTITGVDDVKLNLIAAGAAGVQGPQGPAGTPGTSSGVQQRVAIASNGTWTCPTSVNYVDVTLVGGGAGGGGSTAAGGGSGGGAGATIRRRIPVSPTLVYTINIGTGGPGGTGAADGTNGGDSTFVSPTPTTLITAKGGVKGVKGVAGASTGGLGGSGSLVSAALGGPIDPTLTSTGIVVFNGQGAAIAGGAGGNGGTGTGGANGTAGGGIESYAGGALGAGDTVASGGGGGGGATPFGKGGDAGAAVNNGTAAAAGNYGAGGGGAGGGGTKNGGAGMTGYCLIEYVG